MSKKDSTTPTSEDTEGHAIRKDMVSGAGTEDDTDAHAVNLRGITDAGPDDDAEGNKLK